jgi:hypothetical protein
MMYANQSPNSLQDGILSVPPFADVGNSPENSDGSPLFQNTLTEIPRHNPGLWR